MLDIFSFYHFLWIILIPIIIFGVYKGLQNKSEKFKFWFLFTLTLVAWAVHFSRYWFDPNYATYKLFFVDLCGFSTMMYPLFILTKKKILKDYMYYLGALFAFLSLTYPNTIEGNPMFEYDSIRFFFAHVILMMVPILLVAWKMHEPNIRNLGRKGIIRTADEIVKWKNIFDESELRLNLFTLYIFIEVGGTGGGSFRYMYSRFLKEAAKITGNDKLLEGSKLVNNSGEIFTEIGLLFKDAEKAPDLADRIEKASELFFKAAETEESAFIYIMESIP